MKSFRAIVALTMLLSLCLQPPARGGLTGTQNILVLRVQFKDITGTTFTAAQTTALFNNIAQLWGSDSSYGTITPNFQISSLYSVPSKLATYVDLDSPPDESSGTAFTQLVKDAVANAPSGLNWSNLHSLMIVFADNRAGGFYRGITYQGVSINPPGGSQSLPVSVTGEDPAEGQTAAWGRMAHEVGHELQSGGAGPPHPSDYNSHFEQMDGEYPAQTGVFERESNMGFPGWLPPSKYVSVTAPGEREITLWAAENPPSGEPDPQAAKIFLSFGGTSVYYLVSVRRRKLGDDLNVSNPLVSPTDCDVTATPNGIPDCGVLIERVVEGGDPNLSDCDSTFSNCVNRWVDVLPNTGSGDHLWHVGDVYSSASYGATSAGSDGLTIGVRAKPDADHYDIYVTFNGKIGVVPDIGLQSWLQPPGNTYETTDIWVDSPVNGFAPVANDTTAANYRYGVWSDLLGGVVPTGNGDDPAANQVNRLYARVRNYGQAPATNVVVNFDVTNPLGLGVQGSNGFKLLGSVDKTSFPNLGSIPPGGVVDVYINWTPSITLTPAQIAAGQFFFHSCVRVRLNHVSGETFFGNQDGNGQQENIDYFDATGSGGAPGAPGPANKAVIHLRNDSPSKAQTFLLGVLRDSLPKSWSVVINGGNTDVNVPAGAVVDVPVSIKQNAHEAIGTRHEIRIIASSRITFRDPHGTPPFNAHDEARVLGGVQFQVAVLRKTKLTCTYKAGVVRGLIGGLDPRTRDARVEVTRVAESGGSVRFLPDGRALAPVQDGKFVAKVGTGGRGVCLYAGDKYSTSAGSTIMTF